MEEVMLELVGLFGYVGVIDSYVGNETFVKVVGKDLEIAIKVSEQPKNYNCSCSSNCDLINSVSTMCSQLRASGYGVTWYGHDTEMNVCINYKHRHFDMLFFAAE